jgi:hypothetical protein
VVAATSSCSVSSIPPHPVIDCSLVVYDALINSKSVKFKECIKVTYLCTPCRSVILKKHTTPTSVPSLYLSSYLVCNYAMYVLVVGNKWLGNCGRFERE